MRTRPSTLAVQIRWFWILIEVIESRASSSTCNGTRFCDLHARAKGRANALGQLATVSHKQ